MSPEMLYTASTWVLPAIIAITLHEAAHGFAAYVRRQHGLAPGAGEPQSPEAHRPIRHPLSAGDAPLSARPFLFGYAKPVPVNFSALNHPRRDMVLVAVAGPATNIVLCHTRSSHLSPRRLFCQPEPRLWLAQNLRNALIINVVLAVFNMIPLLPLDGGRVAVGLLPNFWPCRWPGSNLTAS